MPERLVAVPASETRGERLRRLASIVTSVLVHGVLAIVFVVLWRSMVHDLSAQEPISVEIVHSIPGEVSRTAAPEVKLQPPLPAPEAAAPSPPPPSPSTAPDPLLPVPAPAPPAAAIGPTETPSAEGLKPALVEPPPEPKAAAVQPEPQPAPNAVEEQPKDPAPAKSEPPPEQPHVMTSPDTDSTIAPPAPEPPRPAPLERSENAPPPTVDRRAQLAAALPMGTSLSMPSSFRAILSSAGSADGQQYKGAIYGVLGRIRDVGATARRLGMKQGQVGLVLTIGESGNVENLAIMQSSGRPEVDAMVMDMVRQAAPFPPPPPGSSRTFTPMISFGEQ